MNKALGTTTSSTLSNQPTGDQRVSSGAVMTERSKPTPEEMRAEAKRLYGFARMPVRWSQQSAWEACARMKRKADALIAQADAIDAARAQGGAA